MDNNEAKKDSKLRIPRRKNSMDISESKNTKKKEVSFKTSDNKPSRPQRRPSINKPEENPKKGILKNKNEKTPIDKEKLNTDPFQAPKAPKRSDSLTDSVENTERKLGKGKSGTGEPSKKGVQETKKRMKKVTPKKGLDRE